MATDAPFVLSGGIQKSVGDDRDYRYLVLSNGLRVTLVSDPKADKAGAAVAVGVGHFSDPEELPGLAHFLEHMLFLGTEKYPDENSYSAFLNQHGGNSNAFTASEQTNYYFDVQAPYLEEALDRFAQFFTCPLFTASATERELKAVDSEHSKNLQNDMWRLYQLDKSTANPDYPYHKFGTGSYVTLWETPVAAGIDVRARLLEFHQTYYSANIMTLVIAGKEPLDVLESWAQSKFSDIRNTGRSVPVFPGSPYGPAQLAVQQWVVPVKDSHSVILCWPLPEQTSTYCTQSSGYLSHLFGYEGKGSILSLLKKRGWALELSGGCSTQESGFAFFTVDVEVTPEGLSHVDDIISIVYQYTRMLRERGPSPVLYEELAAIAASSFRFYVKSGPAQFCPSLAGNMLKYPAEHTITGPRLYMQYQPELITGILNLLTPQNMRVGVISNTIEAKCTQAEKWYGTKYLQETITEDRIASWLSSPIDDELQVPLPNPFIATDFALRNPVPPAAEEADLSGLDLASPASRDAILGVAAQRVYSPVAVRDDDVALVFFLPDTHFGLPKLHCQFWLRYPPAYESPTANVMSYLFVKIVTEKLNELAYDAQTAKLSYDFSCTTDGFDLSIQGFNHKLPALLSSIVQTIYTLEFSDELFEIYREQLKREYDNFAKSQPYQQCLTNTQCLIQTPRYHTNLKKAPVASLTAADLRAFLPRLLSQVFVEGVVYGNATAEEVAALVSVITERNTGRPLEHDLRFEKRIVSLPYGLEFRYAIDAPNPDDENAALESCFQLEPGSTKQSVLVDLLAHIIKEPFFDQLRTKQQLGYLVFSGTREEDSVPFLRFILQSPKVSAEELDVRVETFLEGFKTTLAKMTEAEFQANVAAVVRRILERPKKPSDIVSQLETSVKNAELVFDHVLAEVKTLLALTPADLYEFYSQNIARGAGRRKLVSLCAAGKVRDATSAAPAEKEEGEEEEEEGQAAPEPVAAAEDVTATLPAVPAVQLDQTTGALVARNLTSAGSSEALRAKVTDSLSRLGIEAPTEGAPFPVVNVTDTALFKASLGAYPQGTAVGLLQWRRKQAAVTSKL